MRASGPLVSVCMVARNGEPNLREHLDSVLGQTLGSLEILLAHEASDERAPRIARDTGDERIRLAPVESLVGPAVYMNACISAAQGEYLALLGSGSGYLSRALESQTQFLDQHPDVGAVFGQPLFVGGDGHEFSLERNAFGNHFEQPDRSQAAWLRYLFLNGNCFSSPTAMVRRSLADSVGSLDPRLFHLSDFDYWVRICLFTGLKVLDRPLVRCLSRGAKGEACLDPDTEVRASWELSRILWRFTKVQDRRLFLETFPDIEGEDAKLPLGFLLARQALSKRHPAWQTFGLELLHSTLADPSVSDELTRHGFGLAEWHRLVLLADAHGMQAVHAMRESLREAHRRLSESAGLLPKKDGEIVELRRQLEQGVADRDTRIASLERLVSERDVHIAGLETVVAERDVRIASLETFGSERDLRIVDLERLVSDRDEKFLALQETRDAEVGRADAVRKELDALRFGFQTMASRFSAFDGGFVRFLEDRLPRTRLSLRLAPNDQLRSWGDDHVFESTGPDPQFSLVPESGSWPSGWLLLETGLKRSISGESPKLYFDNGSGMTEQTFMRIPVSASGSIREIIRLPGEVRALRWDPTECAEVICQKPIVLSRVSAIERWIRMLIRIRNVMRKFPGRATADLGITWSRTLFDLNAVYLAASLLLSEPETRTNQKGGDKQRG